MIAHGRARETKSDDRGEDERESGKAGVGNGYK